MIARAFLLLVMVCLSLAPSRAQSPGDRARLKAWDDSLQRASTLAQLAQLAPGRDARTPSDELRAALHSVRLIELRSPAANVERTLHQLVFDGARSSQWPWVPYALARTFAALHVQRVPPGGYSGTIDGESHASAAWRNLAVMMKIDPEFDPGREYFMEKLVAIGEREMHDDQIAPIQAELKRRYPDPRALLAWGRYLRGEAKYDSAMKIFVRAALAGEDRSRLALERARTFRARGDTASARVAYWDGLHRLTPAGRTAYRYDLQWIIGDDSVKVFDQVPADSVPNWMQRFWDGRDAEAGNHFGERLQEHLIRWVTAVALYRVEVPWRKTDMAGIENTWDGIHPCVASDRPLYDHLWAMQPTYPNDLRDRERLLDHRGLIYLRHGPPLKELGGQIRFNWTAGDRNFVWEGTGTQNDGFMWTIVSAMRHNVSWLYWLNGEYRMLHFRGSIALGMYAPSTMSSYLPFGKMEWYDDVATQAIPEYVRAANQLHGWEESESTGSGGPACNEVMRDVIAKSRRDGHDATASDSDNPPFLDRWAAMAGMYGLGHVNEGNGKALITFARPRAGLVIDSSAAGAPVFPIHFRLVAYNPGNGSRVEIDTVRRLPAPPAQARNEFVTAFFEIPLGPGNWQIAFRVDQGRDSSGFYTFLPRLSLSAEPTVTLSSLVPGSANSRPWQAPDGQEFRVNAVQTWKATEALDLYYEIRGVPAGESYATTLQIRDAADSLRKPMINVGFTDQSGSSFNPTRKNLDLQTLKPGRYLLVVTVTANGRSAQKQSVFEVVKP